MPGNRAGQALAVMEELLKETGDKQLLTTGASVCNVPGENTGKIYRHAASQKQNTEKWCKLLQQQVRQAAKAYPERKFSGKEEKQFREQRKRAQDCAKRMGSKRIPGRYFPGGTVYGIERF